MYCCKTCNELKTFKNGRGGEITNLRVDAIVNPTNETLDDRNVISGSIHRVAGPELIDVCKKELKGSQSYKFLQFYNMS